MSNLLEFAKEIEETLTCGICLNLVYKASTCSPCMHTFCCHCISETFKKYKSCPICRKRVERVHKNHLFDCQIDIYLQAFPHKRKSNEDIQEANNNVTVLKYDISYTETRNLHYQIIAAIEEYNYDKLASLLQLSHTTNTITATANTTGTTHNTTNNSMESIKLALNDVDELGRTPLMRACEINAYKLLPLLSHINNNCDLNIKDYEGATALIISCSFGHTQCVELLCQLPNIDLNTRCNRQTNALIIASNNGFRDIVSILCKYNVNINLHGYGGITALITASCNGHYDCICILLRYTNNNNTNNTNTVIDINAVDDDGDTALLASVYNGYEDCVVCLLNHNANIHIYNNEKNNVIHACIYNKHVNILQTLLHHISTHNNSNTNNSNNSNSIDILINSINNEYMTPLLIACMNGYDDILYILLYTTYISINIYNTYTNWSAIMYTCSYNFPVCLQVLIDYSIEYKVYIDYNIQCSIGEDKGCTALHLAAKEGNIECIHILCNMTSTTTNSDKSSYSTTNICDIDVNMTDDYNRTALMYTVIYNYPDCMYAIVSGVYSTPIDIHTLDKDGKSARDLAEISGLSECIHLLDEYEG